MATLVVSFAAMNTNAGNLLAVGAQACSELLKAFADFFPAGLIIRCRRRWGGQAGSAWCLGWTFSLVKVVRTGGEGHTGTIVRLWKIKVFQFSAAIQNYAVWMNRAKFGVAGQFIAHKKNICFAFVILDEGAAREFAVGCQNPPEKDSQIGFWQILSAFFSFDLADLRCAKQFQRC